MSEDKLVIVTGGNGKLGSAVVRELAEVGYRVLSVDVTRGEQWGNVRSVRADVRDLGEVTELFAGVDHLFEGAPGPARTDVFGVVHLAATPGAGHRPNGATFTDNTAISYNIFTAARIFGVKRVVYASSETLLGLPFGIFPPPSFPVDEEFSVRPRSAYSLSKAVDEEISRHFAEWLPDSAFLGMRFSNVMTEGDYERFPSFEDDPESRAWNAWGYIDARDGATACRLALESSITGAHNYVISATDTVMSTPSSELATRYFPEVPFRHPVEGTDSLLSIEKAERDFGFRAEYSWRDR